MPALVSAVLSATMLGRTTFGRDEMASWQFARLSVPDLFRAVHHVDAVLAPYYLLLHGWSTIGGHGAVWLRLPSALAVVGAVAIAARLGRDAWGAGAGLATGLALAVHPVVVATAVEARPYAGALLLSTVGTALVLAPGPLRRRWYAAAMAGAVVLHLFALTVVVAHLLVARRRELLAPAVAVAAVAVPLALAAHAQRVQVVYIPMPDLSRTISVTRVVTAPGSYGWLVLAAAVALLLATVLVPKLAAKLAPEQDPRSAERTATSRAAVWSAVALVVVPSLMLLVASHLLSPVLQRRYLITAPLGAAILLGGATGLARGRRLVQVVAVIVVLGVAAAGVRDVHAPRYKGADFHGVAAHLAAEARPGDGLQVSIRTSQGGMPAGVALYTGDDAFLADVLRGLPRGEPLTYRRVFTDARSTTATTGLRPVEWLVGVFRTTPSLEAARDLRARGCTRTDLRQEGELALYRFRCPAASVHP